MSPLTFPEFLKAMGDLSEYLRDRLADAEDPFSHQQATDAIRHFGQACDVAALNMDTLLRVSDMHFAESVMRDIDSL